MATGVRGHCVVLPELKELHQVQVQENKAQAAPSFEQSCSFIHFSAPDPDAGAVDRGRNEREKEKMETWKINKAHLTKP